LRQDRLGNRQLQGFCASWARDNLAALRTADPPVPESLHDRAADNWRPLLAIADLCSFGVEARAAAITLTGGDASDESAGVMVLEYIHQLFAAGKGTDRIPSLEIVESLAGMETRPWPEWRAGKPITQRQLARLLEPFGVQPRTIRIGETTLKGYVRESFTDAFSRYLPKTALPSATPSQSLESSDLDADSSVTNATGVTDRSVTETPEVADRNREKPYENKECAGVTDRNGVSGEAEEKTVGSPTRVRCRDCKFFDDEATLCLKLNKPVDPAYERQCPYFGAPR
jgi:putative DNA primase/helicase